MGVQHHSDQLVTQDKEILNGKGRGVLMASLPCQRR